MKVENKLNQGVSELSEQEQGLIRSRLDVYGSRVAVVDSLPLAPYDLR